MLCPSCPSSFVTTRCFTAAQLSLPKVQVVLHGRQLFLEAGLVGLLLHLLPFFLSWGKPCPKTALPRVPCIYTWYATWHILVTVFMIVYIYNYIYM